MNVPTIRYNERQATEAFRAHAALLKAERLNPTLRRNPYWTMLKQDAFEAFSAAFEGMQ